MATLFWELDDTKYDGTVVHGSDYDLLARFASSQTVAALFTLGAGAIALNADGDTDNNSLLVVDAGTEVTVAPGWSIIAHTTKGRVAVRSDVTETVDGSETDSDGFITGSSANYIYQQLILGVAHDDPDSVQSLICQFVVKNTIDEAYGLLLAQVTMDGGGNVSAVDNDVRQWSRIDTAIREPRATFTRVSGSGRLIDSPSDTAIPAVPSPAALAITLPNATYIINGRVVKLAGLASYDVGTSSYVLTGLAISTTESIFVDYDEVANDLVIYSQETTHPTGADLLALRPYPCVGRVTTSGTVTTAIVVTDVDVVYSREYLKDVRDDLDDLIGDGGSGDVTRAEFNALAGQVTALAVRVSALEDALGTGTTTGANESDLAFVGLAVVAASQARDRANDIAAFPGAVWVRDVTGAGQITGDGTLPDYEDGGNWDI